MERMTEKTTEGRPSPPAGWRGAAGFSLIELLAVIAIMAILLGLAVAGLGGASQAARLSEAGKSVQNLLAVGRLEAIARNRLVEVRFLKPQSEGVFLSMVLLLREADGTLSRLSRINKLPDGMIFSEKAALSPLLDGLPEGQEAFALPATGAHSYKSFQFRPDGSTDLPDVSATGRFLTIVSTQSDSDNPANFFAIQIEPLTGKVSSHRP